MKPVNRNAKAKLIFSRFVFCTMMVFLYTCGSGGSGDDSSGTGSVSFGLEMQGQSPVQASTFRTAANPVSQAAMSWTIMNAIKAIKIPYIPFFNISKSSTIDKEDILPSSIYVSLNMKNRRSNYALDGVNFFGKNPAKFFSQAANSVSQFECQTDEYSIATIEAHVCDENDQLIAEGGPWNCEDRKGIISGVKAGDGRIVKVSAKDASGETIFWGKSKPCTVIIGQQTDAGKIYPEPVNRPPELSSIGNQKIDEGELLEFDISATDSDGDRLMFEIGNKPTDANFTFEDFGDGTATAKFSWTPAFDSASNYKVIFKVTDSGVPSLSDFEEITISVGNVPQPPVLSPIGNQQVNEGELLEFDIYATDPDSINLRFEMGNKPADADFAFEDFGDGTATATFSWTPNFVFSGNYPVIFKVLDDYPPPEGPLSDFEEITITVDNICRPPELYPIVAPDVDEGEVLEFTVTAKDLDLPDDDLSFSCISLDWEEECEEYFDLSNQTFSWTPDYGDDGTYTVRFIVTDSCEDPGPQQDFEDVILTVGDVCRPPILDPIGSQTVNEDEELRFTITATDPDLPDDDLSFSCVSLDWEEECEDFFNDFNQTFSWTPGYEDAGAYTVRFIVTDACKNPGPQQDYEDVTITAVDQCPDLVVASISQPTEFYNGESYGTEIQASIKNIGNQAAGASTARLTDRINTQDGVAYNTTAETEVIAPGASVTVTFYLPYYVYDTIFVNLEVEADYKNDVSECDEENNVRVFEDQIIVG